MDREICISTYRAVGKNIPEEEKSLWGILMSLYEAAQISATSLQQEYPGVFEVGE